MKLTTLTEDNPATPFDELWRKRMLPYSRLNFLVNYEYTIEAMGVVEYKDNQDAIDSWVEDNNDETSEHTGKGVLRRLLNRIGELRQSFESIDYNIPDDVEFAKYLVEQVSPHFSVGTVYGSGGYHRYFVRLNGDVEFSAGHAMQSNQELARELGFKLHG